MNVIAQLARVKAVFQQRTITAFVSQPPVDRLDVQIATRALRVHNRSEPGAELYRGKHAILKEGLRK
jgi:hypothetical protein